jgi:hypothetical protein
LTHLEEFWASSNQLSSFQEVEKELADKAELTTVYFEGNPLQTRGPAVYRNKVRLALPQVQQIDASKSLALSCLSLITLDRLLFSLCKSIVNALCSSIGTMSFFHLRGAVIASAGAFLI